MTSLYLRTDDDVFHVLDQIFLAVAFEIESADTNDDNTHTVHATWQGNCMSQVMYRCYNLEEVIDYQILGDEPDNISDIGYW